LATGGRHVPQVVLVLVLENAAFNRDEDEDDPEAL
jgi:hypothetical protein